MDIGNAAAIISAASGIVGVVVGNSFVAVKESLVSRSKQRRDVSYLAIIVVSHLDRFANGCLHVACDDGTYLGAPAGKNGEHEATTNPPEFQPLDIDVEWKVLPRDLMYSILRIPDDQEQVHNKLGGMDEEQDDFPEHAEYFRVRRREYAVLGLEASAVARRLRKYGGMPDHGVKPGERDRDKALTNVIVKIDAAQAEINRRVAAYRATLQSGPMP